jgi:hypothetical protein
MSANGKDGALSVPPQWVIRFQSKPMAILRDFSLSKQCALLYYSLERSGEQFTGRGHQHAYGPPEFTKALAASSNETSFWQMGHVL